MDEKYHPDLDDSPLCDPETASKFRSVIVITLGRFDVNFATMSLSRFNMAPREGHLRAAIRILDFLKAFPKGTLLLDNTYPDHLSYKTNVEQDWTEFYPDVEEDIPHDMLTPKGKALQSIMYLLLKR